MNFRLYKSIVFFTMLVCLPLQGLAAITMPGCAMNESSVELHVDADNVDSMHNCHNDDNQPSKSTFGNKCSYCFLTLSHAITPFNISVELDSSTALFSDMFAKIPDLVPTSPYTPPRSALS